MHLLSQDGHVVVGGANYGQGSSREHAALAPRFLGLRVALVKDFARIHWQNLVNFGVLPLTFINIDDYDKLSNGDVLSFSNLRSTLQQGNEFKVMVKGKNILIDVRHALSGRQLDIILKGGLINWVRDRQNSVSTFD